MTADSNRAAGLRAHREPRHEAREAALQMLYQWEVGKTPIDEVIRTFWRHRSDPEAETHGPPHDLPSGELQQLATVLAGGVAANVQTLDPVIGEAAEHWRIERMAGMDRLILRLAVYEFRHRPETPGRVVINEALELARTFSSDDAVRFINGILDSIRRTSERE